MMGFHTDPASGNRYLRPTRAANADGSPPADTSYMDLSNRLQRDNVQRAALDKRTVDEHKQDVPYGWNVPRYAHHMMPRINRQVQDPAATYYGGTTPHAKFAQSEFRHK
jgi:hypothetical protein